MSDLREKLSITPYISEVYPILEHNLYNIAVYRTLSSIYPVNDTPAIIEDPYKRDFWINTSNNAIQMAIIDWCKVFGSKYNNDLHYSNHLEIERIEVIESVEDFEQVKDSMTRFRNKYIAHKDYEPVPVLVLDGAMQAMFEFDEKIRELYELNAYPGLKDCLETYMIRIQDLLGIEERE